MADRSPMPDVVVVLPGIMQKFVLTKNGKTIWGYYGKLVGTTLLHADWERFAKSFHCKTTHRITRLSTTVSLP